MVSNIGKLTITVMIMTIKKSIMFMVKIKYISIKVNAPEYITTRTITPKVITTATIQTLILLNNIPRNILRNTTAKTLQITMGTTTRELLNITMEITQVDLILLMEIVMVKIITSPKVIAALILICITGVTVVNIQQTTITMTLSPSMETIPITTKITRMSLVIIPMKTSLA